MQLASIDNYFRIGFRCILIDLDYISRNYKINYSGVAKLKQKFQDCELIEIILFMVTLEQIRGQTYLD